MGVMNMWLYSSQIGYSRRRRRDGSGGDGVLLLQTSTQEREVLMKSAEK